jgi:hypothetical protein
MKTIDPLEQWKSRRAQVEVDDGFADRVLERLRAETPPVRTQPRRGLDWLGVAKVAAAIVLGVAICIGLRTIVIGLVLGLLSQTAFGSI